MCHLRDAVVHALAHDLAEVVHAVEEDVVHVGDLGFDVARHREVDDEDRAMAALLIARSSMPLPRMGSGLGGRGDDDVVAGNSSGSAVSGITPALKRSASGRARSAVRLATVILRGCCAAKWVMHNSIISPAPMNRQA